MHQINCISCLFRDALAIVFSDCLSPTKMDTGPYIEITQHKVQDKSKTPGITLTHEGHQGHPAAALKFSLNDKWSCLEAL